MQRKYTNIIRFVLDECLPPILRDSRWFMYPFFYYWFKGKRIGLYMDFKTAAYRMTREELAEVYDTLDHRARDRKTDLSRASIEGMLNLLDDGDRSLLDVGCGNGYWLNIVSARRPSLAAMGCDVHETPPEFHEKYRKADIYDLPFEDKSFDVVTCCHTLEHLVDLQKPVSELKRVARKKIIIVVPRQRYYYYTLDMHLHFFAHGMLLANLMNFESYTCVDVKGDWLYIGYFK